MAEIPILTEVDRKDFKTIKAVINNDPKLLSLTRNKYMNENLKETLADLMDILALSLCTFGDGVQVKDIFELPKFYDLGKDVEKELAKAVEEAKHLTPEAWAEVGQLFFGRLKDILTTYKKVV